MDPKNFGLGEFLAKCAGAVFVGSILGMPNSRLGGRSVDEQKLCACNASYVSRGCCGSKDGLIWEPPGMKMGELRRDLEKGQSSEALDSDLV